MGIICGPHRDHLLFGIICGSIWGSFPVWGSFAVGDHLRRCTELLFPVAKNLLKKSAKKQRIVCAGLDGQYKCYWNSQTKTRSICSDEEDEGENEKLVSTQKTSQCSKKCLSSMESQEAGTYHMEPPSPLQALGVNPFPSRFINRAIP